MRVHPRTETLAARSGPFPSHVLERAAADLDAAATARESQLNNLPNATTPVAVAHRDSVRRILDAIRRAQAQLAAGTYGSCIRCGRRADPATALARPWAPQCATCSLG
jgi:DnaK suppressor protein